MSQQVIYDVLKALGGQATSKEIRKGILDMYPHEYRYLKQRYWNKIKKLRKWEIVSYSHKTGQYYIINWNATI